MKATLLSIVSACALLQASFALAANSVPVTVKEGDKSYLGTLFLPDHPQGALPLVAVVHEWWGKTDYPEMRAKKLADELGYAALAVDLYGAGKTADNPTDAQNLAAPFYQNPEMGVKLLDAFIEAAPAAAKQAGDSIDMEKIAAIGYCFGGAQVLNLARAGKLPSGKLLGVVSFHGGLASKLKAKAPIQPKLLVLHGADDKFVSPQEVKAFKSEMRKDKAHMTFYSFPGATHAFTNPGATELGKKFNIPIAYNAEADKESWDHMKSFLHSLFGK